MQTDTFTPADADSYFGRNRNKLTTPRDNIVLPLLQMYDIRPKKVLDIGCGNGHRLAAINNHYGCEGYGCDVSGQAIEDGRRRWPDLILRRGRIEGLPYAGAAFDCVLLVFVLHWIARERLAYAMAEVHRVLEPGGFLILADFAPDYPQAVSYRHRYGVWTYKQNYPAMFMALGAYTEIARFTFDHDDDCKTAASVPSERRGAVSLLQKTEG